MNESPATPISRESLSARLKPPGQEHLLQFWDELDAEGRARLARQIAAIDFERITELYDQAATAQDWAAISRTADPPPAIRLTDRAASGA